MHSYSLAHNKLKYSLLTFRFITPKYSDNFNTFYYGQKSICLAEPRPSPYRELPEYIFKYSPTLGNMFSGHAAYKNYTEGDEYGFTHLHSVETGIDCGGLLFPYEAPNLRLLDLF